MGVIEGENIDVPIPIVVEKITMNSNVDQMVRQDNSLVDESSQLEPTTDFKQVWEQIKARNMISLPLWRTLR